MLLNHPSLHSPTHSSFHSSASISTISSIIHMPVFSSIHSFIHMPMFPSVEVICQYLPSASQSLLLLFLLYPPVPAFPTIYSPMFLYSLPFTHLSIHLSFYFPDHLSSHLLSQPSIHSSKPKAPVCSLNLIPALCEMEILMLMFWERLWDQIISKQRPPSQLQSSGTPCVSITFSPVNKHIVGTSILTYNKMCTFKVTANSGTSLVLGSEPPYPPITC